MAETTHHRERSTVGSASYLAGLMAELDRAAISTRIRQARTQAGFRNRAELADLLHVHWRTIEDWENPKNTNVPWDRLDEIGRATGVTREWLLQGDREDDRDDLAALSLRLQSLEGQVAEQLTLTREALELLRAAKRRDAATASARRRSGD